MARRIQFRHTTENLIHMNVDGNTKDIRLRGRDSLNDLEVGDAMQSSVPSSVSSALAMPVIVNC